MAISDKLNYLIETKQLFKDRLNSLGAEITSSTTFRNYLTWLDTFYGEVSDKTDLSQNGVVGRTSQESTTGKNTLPQDKYIASRTINGITYTNNGDGTFDLNGTATANTSLRIIDVGIFNLESGQRYYLYSSVAYNSTTFNMSIVTTESGTQKFLIANGNYTPSTTPTSSRLQFYIASGDTVNVQNVKLMLVKGADDTSYEPYTNGASPNPDYPQPINNLSGDVPYKVSGKNLFDKTNFTNNYRLNINGIETYERDYYVSTYIKVKPNTKYTKNSPTEDAYHRICFYSNNDTDSFISASNDNTNTTPNNCNYVRFCGLQSELDTTQFEQGDTSTTYEPYISRTFTIPLGDIELCKIDTYEDKIYSSSGRFYLNKNIGKVTLNGTETVTRTTTNVTGYYRFNINIGTNIYTTDTIQDVAPFYCNKFVNGSRGKSWTLVDCIYPTTSAFTYGSFGIYYDATKEMTTTQFQNWLSQNGIVVYYPYATPTTTEITQENYPSLYNALKQIQDYLTAYKINKEFILGYSSPEIEY